MQSEKNLSQLPEDCLRELILYLDSVSQISFAATCLTFENVIQNHRKLQYGIEWNISAISCHKDIYNYYLNTTRHKVKKIILDRRDLYSFMEICAQFIFPALESLQIVYSQCVQSNPNTKVLQKYPNLIPLLLDEIDKEISLQHYNHYLPTSTKHQHLYHLHQQQQPETLEMQQYSFLLILAERYVICFDYIIKYLDFPSQINFARTCKQFEEIMISRWNTEWNAKDFTLPVYQTCCDLESYKYFLNAMSFTLEKIYLSGPTFDSFMKLCENVKFPAMKRFKLIAAYTSDTSMTNCIAYWKMLSKCPNLIELKLENCLVQTSRMKFVKKLSTLHLRRCTFRNSHSNNLSDHLQYTHLTKLHLIDLDGIASLPLLCMANFSALQELCLMHEFFIVNPGLIKDVCALASLKSLIICFVDQYTRESVADILKKLSSELCQRFCYLGISPKFTSWPFNSQLAENCLTNTCALRVLEFYWADLSLLKDTIPTHVLMYLTELEEFILTYCNNISQMYLLDMIKNCPNLKYLDLKECENLTDDFIWEAAKYLLSCGRRTLIVNVTDSSLSTDINKHPEFWQYKSFLKIIDETRKVPEFYKDCYYCFAFKLNDVSNL